MNKPRQRPALTFCLIVPLMLGLTPGGLLAGPTILDQAVTNYYAGRTTEAIAIIRPLASAGDVEAQYLLGNILFTLSNAGQLTTQEDPAHWYRMAADQDSAPASYALGVIHNNRWLRSHRDEDLQLAESYLQKALDLGVQEADKALKNLATYKKENSDAASLTYNNESFSSKQKPVQEQPAKSKSKSASASTRRSSTLSDTLAGFKSSGDLDADAELLKHLINQLNEDGQITDEDRADASSLSQLLGGLESAKELLPDLLQLFDHLEEASKINTAPGTN